MAYQKTNWQNGVTPLSAANMNKIEQGIEDAAEREELNSHKAETATNDVHGIKEMSDNVQDLHVRVPVIDLGYSEMISHMEASDVTISSNTTLTNAFNVYNNLTINTGRILSVPSDKPSIILVKGILALNGTISAEGRGGNGGIEPITGAGNTGGNGGGTIVLFANQIMGAGTIKANGTNASQPVWKSLSPAKIGGESGDAGRVFFEVIGGGGAGGTFGGSSAGVWPEEVLNAIEIPPYLLLDIKRIGGAGGGSGAYINQSDDGKARGAGGAAGCGGGGGAGGNTGREYPGIGGGGGGGGGLIIIKSDVIPAITLTASGGNGSNGVGNTAGGGAGGGGGLVLQIAKTTTANVNIAGGNGGTGRGTYGYIGDNGEAGITKLFQI